MSSVLEKMIERRQRPWFKELFREQRSVLRSPARRKAILCGRRAGKTVAAAAALIDALEDAQFDEAIVYAARTRVIAKRLIWGKLHRLAANSGKKWTFSEADLTITNERGAYLIIAGMDKAVEIEKLRGLKLRLFVGDEPATYTHVLDSLYDEVLEPAAADLDGEIWLIGTPGPILAGFWHSASTGAQGFQDWHRAHWTMFDNPHMHDPKAYLERVLARKGIDHTDPTIRQEFFGEWVQDDSAQVYRYSADINDHNGLPPGYRPEKWVHTVCVDFGVVDDFAWTVEASHPNEATSYIVDQGAETGLLIGQMADIVRRMVETYNVHFLGGDPGGGGKSLIEEWNRRYADRAGNVLMHVVEKTEKRANIDIYNSDLRTGRIKLCMPTCAGLAKEFSLLPWANASRLKEHPGYPNNRADSALYAHRHHRAYLHALPTRTPRPPHTLDPDDPTRIAAEENVYTFGSSRDWWDV